MRCYDYYGKLRLQSYNYVVTVGYEELSSESMKNIAKVYIYIYIAEERPTTLLLEYTF